MKSSILLALISSVLVLSCRGTSTAPDTLPNSAREYLLGSWNLVKYSGGIIGETVEVDQDRPMHATYTADGRYIVVVRGDTATNSNYTVTEENAPGSPAKKNTVITYSNYMPNAIVDSVSETRLITNDMAADGYTHYYHRIVGGK